MENKRILAIDDEPDVLEFLKLLLETSGYYVTTAENCQAAIDLLRNNDFFLIITDIAMPQMDGYEIISELKKIKPDISFAVMTGFGYNPNHTLVRIQEDGNVPCIFKPFNRDKILALVEKAWGRHKSRQQENHI